ncbi:MAG: RNA polymerase sigma factor [Polyangiaceae bacterium]
MAYHEHADDVLSLLPGVDRDEGETVRDPEVEWLDRLRRGEDAALTRLYREHHGSVRAFVRRLTSHSGDVEDLVHDVFVAAPSAFQGFRGEGSVRAFIFSIAVHHVHHHVRASARRRSWLDRFRLAPREHASPPTPEAQHERRELARRLDRALATLSFEHRAAVVLCELEEMTSAEAAEVLHVPEGTVRTRLFHAKKKLRALLEEDAP